MKPSAFGEEGVCGLRFLALLFFVCLLFALIFCCFCDCRQVGRSVGRLVLQHGFSFDSLFRAFVSLKSLEFLRVFRSFFYSFVFFCRDSVSHPPFSPSTLFNVVARRESQSLLTRAVNLAWFLVSQSHLYLSMCGFVLILTIVCLTSLFFSYTLCVDFKKRV